MLETRLREVSRSLDEGLREARSDAALARDVLDDAEQSDLEVQDGITAAVARMRSESLQLIRAALQRLDEGTYGICAECGADIPEARLRALPFALRCRACEESHERRASRSRAMARRTAGTLFLESSR
jgi:DnaK suppressor protein